VKDHKRKKKELRILVWVGIPFLPVLGTAFFLYNRVRRTQEIEYTIKRQRLFKGAKNRASWWPRR